MYDSMNNTQADNNHALDWDSPIEHDGEEFVLLPEGNYDFTVTEFQRGRFPGSQKIPACPKAVLTLRITAPSGESASVKTDLILWGTLEWKIAAFFRSIGQKKHGETFRPNWDAIKGAKGRASVGIRTYINKNNKEVKVNDIEKFLDPTSDVQAKPAAAPAPQPAKADSDDDLLG